MPTVAHLNRHWLPHTQTFIYNYVAHANRYTPVVYSEVYLENPSFEVDCTYLITRSHINAIEATNPDFLSTFFDTLDYPTCFESSCNEHDVSVLHAHFGFNGEAALSLRERTNLPLVTSFYGVDASRYLRKRNAYKKLFERGECFIALGPDMADRLSSAGCPEEKITLHPLAIDLDRFSSPGERTETGKTTLLFCGRLIEKKGLHDLFSAMDLLPPDTDVRLRIVGEGPLMDWCRCRASESERDIELLGRQSHAAVRDFMASADIFVLPSVTSSDGDTEGTPTVLLEAQAMGLPVISTKHADIPSIVDHETTGLLIDEHAPEDLAKVILRLLANPDERTAMGKAGRKHIEDTHDIKQNIDLLEAVYDSLG
jgi:colanic acid/amylovoran biosynthesis glycosyltransferase